MDNEAYVYEWCDCDYNSTIESNLAFVEWVDDYVCFDCLEENYFTCNRCDNHTHHDALYVVNDYDWCEPCFEQYSIYCEHCDTYYNSESVSINEDSICEFCDDGEDDSDIIHPYSYKPGIIVKLLKFNKSAENDSTVKELVSVGFNAYNRMIDKKTDLEQTLFKSRFGNCEDTAEIIGFELEVENKTRGDNYISTGDLANDFYNAIDDKDEQYVYLKSDGSLDNGFEIVTHPQSYGAWMNSMDRYQPIFDLPKHGIRSHDTKTCGLHFSLNRKAMSPMHLVKFSTFIYWNPIFIKDISRRSWRNITSWANVFSNHNYNSIDENEIKGIMSSKKNIEQWLDRNTFYTKCGDLFHPLYTKKSLINNHRNLRSTAVNLPSNRVECRFFRGTLKKETFIMNLQFIHSVYEFTKQATFENLSIIDFLKFNKKNDFRYVNEYLNCLPTDQIRFYHDYYLDAVRNERDFKNRKEPCSLFTNRDDDNYKIRSRR